MRLIRPILWDRIVSAASPRVTSGDAADGQVEAFDRAMFSQCFEGILRTCRGEPAAWLLERRYAYLIETDQEDKRSDRNLLQYSQHIPALHDYTPSGVPSAEPLAQNLAFRSSIICPMAA